MSIIFVLVLISEHGILSCSFRPNISLSIVLCAIFSLFVHCFVVVVFFLRPCLAAVGHCWQDTWIHYLSYGELSVLEYFNGVGGGGGGFQNSSMLL